MDSVTAGLKETAAAAFATTSGRPVNGKQSQVKYRPGGLEKVIKLRTTSEYKYNSKTHATFSKAMRIIGVTVARKRNTRRKR